MRPQRVPYSRSWSRPVKGAKTGNKMAFSAGDWFAPECRNHAPKVQEVGSLGVSDGRAPSGLGRRPGHFGNQRKPHNPVNLGHPPSAITDSLPAAHIRNHRQSTRSAHLGSFGALENHPSAVNRRQSTVGADNRKLTRREKTRDIRYIRWISRDSAEAILRARQAETIRPCPPKDGRERPNRRGPCHQQACQRGASREPKR